MMTLKRSLPLLRKIKSWLSKFILTTMLLGICCYIYAKKIEPNWIEVVPIQLTIPHLAPAFADFKIVQISDLHISKFMTEQRLNKIIQLVNQQQPDAIAFTGDLITQDTNFDPQKLAPQLTQLKPKWATLAVLGNHDHWRQDIAFLKRTFSQNNITLLNNQVYLIEDGSQQLAIAGIDDPYWGEPNLAQTIAQIPENVLAILLVHEPDYIDISAKTHKFILQLSGHSHGGQVRIPWLAPLVLPYKGRKYFAGLNQVEGTYAYTNRGLGMTGIPMRFGSRPEITVFTLHPAS